MATSTLAFKEGKQNSASSNQKSIWSYNTILEIFVLLYTGSIIEADNKKHQSTYNDSKTLLKNQLNFKDI